MNATLKDRPTAPQRYKPPTEVAIGSLRIDIEAPPATAEELSVFNSNVGAAIREHREALRKRSVNLLEVSISELQAETAERQQSILAALQYSYGLAGQAVDLCSDCAAAWRKHRETLQNDLKKAESDALKVLSKLHPGDDPRRLQGRLADVDAIKNLRRDISTAGQYASAFEGERKAMELRCEVIMQELQDYCDFLRD